MASTLKVNEIQNLSGNTALTIDSNGIINRPQNICFLAYVSSNTTQPAGSWSNEVTFDATEFNVGGCYSTSTYRFTPTAAGYYQVNASVNTDMTSGTSARFFGRFYKNNAIYGQFGHMPAYSSDRAIIGGSMVIYFDGVSDYVDIRVSTDGGTTLGINGNVPGSSSGMPTHFSGYLIG